MNGDLHTHSTFSDGSTPIEQLPRLAARAGLGWLAVSDHDTLRSAEYAYAHPEQAGVRLIPAVELSARDTVRGRRVHILCYWPDTDSRDLRLYCDYMAAERVEVGRRNAADLAREEPRFDPAWAEPLWQASGVPCGLSWRANRPRLTMGSVLPPVLKRQVCCHGRSSHR